MNLKIKKLFSYYKPYKKAIALNLLFTVLAGVAELAIPLIVRCVTNEILNFEINKALKIITILSTIVVTLLMIHYFSTKHITRFGRNTADSISRDMRMELFKHYQKQSFDFFDENDTGKLVSAMHVDIYSLSDFLSRTPEIILEFFVRFIGVSVVFFYLNIWFSIIIFLILGIVLFYVSYLTPTIQKKFMQSHEKISDVNGYIDESLAGIRVTQSLNNEVFECEKFKKLNDEHLKIKKNINKIMSILDTGLNSLAVGVIPVITIISMFFVINKTLSLNDLIVYILYTEILLKPIFSITGILFNCQEAIAGYERFIQTLEIRPHIVDSSKPIILKNISGNIEFKNVDFSYAKSKENIFNNLNLKINSGEYIALVGSSGVGKTTLCNLIPRFYDVLNGEVKVDNINVKDIELKQLRQSIGFVHQDTFLFSDTIMENIRFGKPNAKDEEIIEAAKNAYAHDFITKFPFGYDTKVGQRGVKLSGGQKQRIAIARIFLKNPSILIFDEATSSLDNESERFVQKSLEKLSKNRTTIVIAHRLSTIKNANRILVLAKGKIFEEGTHEELLQKNGIYASLYNLL